MPYSLGSRWRWRRRWRATGTGGRPAGTRRRTTDTGATATEAALPTLALLGSRGSYPVGLELLLYLTHLHLDIPHLFCLGANLFGILGLLVEQFKQNPLFTLEPILQLTKTEPQLMRLGTGSQGSHGVAGAEALLPGHPGHRRPVASEARGPAASVLLGAARPHAGPATLRPWTGLSPRSLGEGYTAQDRYYCHYGYRFQQSLH